MKLRHIALVAFLLVAAPATAVVITKPHALLVNAALATSTDGAAAVLQSKEGPCAGRLHVTNTSGTLPTFDASIQYSVDNTIWFTLLTFLQVTTGATNNDQAVHYDETLTRQYPYVRAHTTLGGTLPVYNASIYLDCD